MPCFTMIRRHARLSEAHKGEISSAILGVDSIGMTLLRHQVRLPRRRFYRLWSTAPHQLKQLRSPPTYRSCTVASDMPDLADPVCDDA
jgi:hypothetical protein